MITQDQPTIFDPAKVRAILTSRQDGTTKASTDDVTEVTDNLRKVADVAGIDFDGIVAMNVGAHDDQWDEIADIASRPDHALISQEDRVICDAIVTRTPGVTLLLPVADCNAVGVHDPVQGVIALVHLGWKSTVAELATKIVQHLQQKYGSSATDLRVFFSPAIKSESYIFESVGQADSPDWKPFLHQAKNGVGVDLPGYNRQRFIDAGVPPEHIQTSPVNTATSENYYSHYRSVRSGEPEGRFALLVGLK
jgi:copper oxidase (laccase) domain-containing protein